MVDAQLQFRLIIFFIVLIGSFFSLYTEGFQKKSSAYIVIVFLSIVISLLWLIRDFEVVGIDSKNYLRIFYDPSIHTEKLEILFLFLIGITKMILPNHLFFFFICFFIINFNYLKSFYLVENKYFLFIYLLFLVSFLNFNIHMNILRQGIAMSFFSLSIVNLLKNRKWKYIINAILATSFHSSAIIVFILPIFLNLKLTKKKGVIFLLASLIILYTHPLVIIISPLKEFSPYMMKLYKYFTWPGLTPAKIKHVYYLYLFFATFILYNLDKVRKKIDLKIINMFLTAFFVYTLFGVEEMVADRMFFYFYSVIFSLIAKILYIIKDKRIVFLGLNFLTLFWLFKSLLLQYQIWFVFPYPALN